MWIDHIYTTNMQSVFMHKTLCTSVFSWIGVESTNVYSMDLVYAYPLNVYLVGAYHHGCLYRHRLTNFALLGWPTGTVTWWLMKLLLEPLSLFFKEGAVCTTSLYIKLPMIASFTCISKKIVVIRSKGSSMCSLHLLDWFCPTCLCTFTPTCIPFHFLTILIIVTE